MIYLHNKETPLNEKAYLYIKRKVLDCEYLPGEKLFEKQISNDIDIGRTPVREALLQLQGEGFVEIVPRQGIFVKEITNTEVSELYQLRKLIDPNVAANYKRSIDKTQLINYSILFSKLNEQPQKEIDKEYYQTDIEFHSFIVEATNNSLLVDFYDKVMKKQYQLGIYSSLLKKNNTREQTTHEHQAIIKAILAEDDEEIHNTVLAHINSSLLSSLETLAFQKNKS